MTAEYRAYVIGDDGHIAGRIELLSDSDESAIQSAEQMLDGHPIALWQGKRRVTTLLPKTSTEPDHPEQPIRS